jgi:hypothetical protein
MSRTSCCASPDRLSAPVTTSIRHSPSACRGGDTEPGRVPAHWRTAVASPVSAATYSGTLRPGGNSLSSASCTTRALRSVGSTLASTPVNSIRRNGSPIAISSTAVAAAIGPGRRITACEKRYQGPACTCLASRSSASFQRFRPSAFTRGPRTASSAGSTVSDTSAAVSATSTPP